MYIVSTIAYFLFNISYDTGYVATKANSLCKIYSKSKGNKVLSFQDFLGGTKIKRPVSIRFE